MKQIKTVLSLFDGMSCGQIALKQLDIKTQYYASEIDKYAIAVTQHRNPNTIQLGDITQWKEWNINWANIDLIMGGSPCTGFSFAGKQLNFEDPGSKLFFIYMDILNHIRKLNPGVKFLLENVRMKKEHSDKITELIGVEPMIINSSLVSAQNRIRLYWFNWEVKQPKDKGLLLKDILETNVDSRYVFSDRIGKTITGKNALNKIRVAKRFPNQKSRCLTAGGQTATNAGATNVPHIIENQQLQTIKEDGERSGIDLPWRRLTPKECERLQTVPDDYTLAPHPVYKNKMMSDTQRYKMLGNGWTTNVIRHIFEGIKFS